MAWLCIITWKKNHIRALRLRTPIWCHNNHSNPLEWVGSGGWGSLASIGLEVRGFNSRALPRRHYARIKSNVTSADGRAVSTLRYKGICMPIESWPCSCLVCVRDWYLTYWDPLTHICFGNLTIIGSDNGLPPGWHQVINWTNAGILLGGL